MASLFRFTTVIKRPIVLEFSFNCWITRLNISLLFADEADEADGVVSILTADEVVSVLVGADVSRRLVLGCRVESPFPGLFPAALFLGGGITVYLVAVVVVLCRAALQFENLDHLFQSGEQLVS